MIKLGRRFGKKVFAASRNDRDCPSAAFQWQPEIGWSARERFDVVNCRTAIRKVPGVNQEPFAWRKLFREGTLRCGSGARGFY